MKDEPEEKKYYQPTIYDAIAGVILLFLFWYFDVVSYFESAVNWLFAVTLGW